MTVNNRFNDNINIIFVDEPINFNNGVEVDEKEISMKTSCLAALGNLIEDLDREDLLPYFDQIHEALRLNVSGQGTVGKIRSIFTLTPNAY